MKPPVALSPRGAKFIARWEGLVLHPYNDALGYATIGIGHLLHKSRVTVADWRRWTAFKRTDAYTLLQKDAETAAAAVRRSVKPVLTQPQFDALVSFTFNCGVGAFEDSTLLRRLNQQRAVGAAAKAGVSAELLRWVNRGTPAEAGLRRRRLAEGELFTTGRYQ